MTETRKLLDALWPARAEDMHGPEERRAGYRRALDRAVYRLDRLPLGRRLALSWLVLTWPWRD